MTKSQAWFGSERFVPEFFKLFSIGVLAVGIGILSATYSPLFALVGTGVFALLAIMLYVSSHFRTSALELNGTAVATVTEPKNRVLFYVFYLAFFVSITIPKSGKTIGNIPVTTANMLILFALLCWLIKFVGSENLVSRIPLFKSITVFIFYGIASGLIGFVNNNPRKAVILDFVAFIGFTPVYFLVCSVLRTKNQLQKLIQAIVLSLLIVCLYGVLQTKIGFERVAIPGITEQSGIIMYPEFGGRWNIIEGGRHKLYSTFQNGNILGNHLATFIPFLGGILLGIRSFWKKVIFAGGFIFTWYILYLTYSRGAVVGAVSGILVLAVLSKKIDVKTFIGVLIFLIVLVIFFTYYADRPGLARYSFRRVTENPNQFSAGRVERAEQALAGFLQLPFVNQLFGIGFGGVLISPDFWRFEYVDNLYLTLLFKMGIVGIVLLFLMLGRLFLTLIAWRTQIPDLQIRGLMIGGIAGLASSLVHNTADVLWFFPPLSANFWFLAGITVCIGMIGRQQQESPAMNQI
jgi:O-antigen ligase